jgi:polyribonucleotide nucleotidyltransferase
VRISIEDGKFIYNPTYQETDNSNFDLRITGTNDAILMVECAADEVDEATVVEALVAGQEAFKPLIEVQEEMRAAVGKEKRVYLPVGLAPETKDAVRTFLENRLDAFVAQDLSKSEQDEGLNALRSEAVESLSTDGELEIGEVREAFGDLHKQAVRSRILETKTRTDGRGLNDVREISAEIDFSPRAHGSGLFSRGETQVLTLATLGTPRERQVLDGLSPLDEKRYMHHYNFPPFSVGETKFLRGSSRREIGHGALAERALVPVLPPVEDFPYTLRLVSEVLSSNGSTSMASVCDMDFKVAGTRTGITALQMDIKIKGITSEIMSQALDQALQARILILDKIEGCISEPRADLKPHAPRMTVVKIDPEKIGAVIGPGGKVIRTIQEETGAKIDIQDDGTVFIAASDGPSADRAREMVESLIEEAVVGRIYTGRVVRTTDFGAFVEILPRMDGLVHISQLDSEHVEKVEDIAKVGDEITVMVTNIDREGKIRLSRQAVLEGWTPEEAMEKDRKPKRRSGGGRSGGSRRGKSGS